MEGIHTDDAHYAKCYSIFVKNELDQHHEQWIRDNIVSVAQTSYVVGTGPLRILSIGCGPGGPDKIILDQLITKYDVIHYTAVDPSEDHLLDFKKNVIDNANYSKVSFCMIKDDAEGFIAKPREGSYDIILFWHVMHYVNSVEDTLRNYYPLLTKKGYLLSTMLDETQGIWKMWPEFGEKFVAVETKRYFTSIDVEEALDKLGFIYSKNPIVSMFNVTSIIEESEEGSLLLDFYLHIKNFKKDATPENYKAVIDRIKDLAKDKSSPMGDTFVHSFDDLFMITKSA